MAYDIDSITEDCYEGTACLINKFNVKDERVLSALEAEITFAKSAKLEVEPIMGNYDEKHYKSIHKFLFGDLYDWAGEFRKINLSKKGTKFVDCNKLNDLSKRIFSRIKELKFYRDLSFDEFITEIVDLYCSLNMLHPFREGNGRTQRIFLAQLIRYNDYDINFSEVDKDLLLIATIQSAQGITDNLRKIFEENIKK